MSLKICVVKVWSEIETNKITLLLTSISDIWNYFLPSKIGIRSLGIKLRKLKYVLEPFFIGTKWGCFI